VPEKIMHRGAPEENGFFLYKYSFIAYRISVKFLSPSALGFVISSILEIWSAGLFTIASLFLI
jgi:hypothetical protein